MLVPLTFLLNVLGSAFCSSPITEYRGIRYTEQPSRFAPTSTPLAFDTQGEFDDYGNVCLQDTTTIDMFGLNVTMDEDCLFLNVFTPNDDNNRNKLLPVMFYLHGGGYTQGYSQQLDARRLAREYDVVTITINYRLGAMGFFASPDIAAEDPDGATGGANGVRDQVRVVLERRTAGAKDGWSEGRLGEASVA